MDVASWLRNLGLERYEAAFRENDVDAELLPNLTANDLKELGITSLGHRRRLLEAIAALRLEGKPAVASVQSPTDPTGTTAERRPLTVMFCDLVGSTALSARLDPEDLREVIRTYQTRVASTIQKFEGFIARYVGDGVLIYFGWPEARETDVERAVRAGLAVAAAVSETQVGGEPLQVRIGIATGLVVVGEPIGSGDSRQQTAVGETPNRAARLQSLAGSNQVVIDAATRRQIGGLFECLGLGTVDLKGLPAPVPAWRVVTENQALGQFEALRSGLTPLVGREEDLELLLRRWMQAKAGMGRAVLISAEPGIGKSRLAEALAERLVPEPHARLRCFCSPHHQDNALYPVIAQMERAAGFAHGDTPDGRAAKLQALLAATAPPLDDVALIAGLHGLRPADLAPLPDLTPQRRKEKTFEALLRQTEGLARQRPVLMVFDDIQWINPTSRELLDRLIERVAGWPVLLLALFRPEFQPPWVGQPHVTLLSLARLDRRDTAAMIANVADIAGDTPLQREIVEEIAERTDGVPLFIEEVTKAVVEAGAQLSAALSGTPHPRQSVPPTLHASLMARLDRLGPAAREVAQAGAAIGREFGYELLASITDLPEAHLQEALDRLTNAGLLFVRGTPPNAGYLFKHVLVQDAAYGSLLRDRRQGLHRRIAAILDQRFPDVVQAHPTLLAQHCHAAGLADQAVVYWVKATQQAQARGAAAEVMAQARKGLEVLAGLPGGAWRQHQELNLQIPLGFALMATRGFAAAETVATLARAQSLAEQLDRPEHFVPLLLGRWSIHFTRADLRLALSLGKQIEDIGRVRNDVATKALGRLLQGISRFYLGELVPARALLEEHADQVLEERADQADGFVDPQHAYFHVLRLAFAGLALVLLGHIDQAHSRIDDALSLARQGGNAFLLAQVLMVGTLLEHITGLPWRHAAELLALSTEQKFPLALGWALALHGWSLVDQGQAEEGIAYLLRGLTELRSAGTVVGVSNLHTPLARAYAMLGRSDEKRNCLVEAAKLIETTDERFLEAEVLHRVPGDLLAASGDRLGAEQHYRQAIAVAERQNAKLLELWASASLARLWRDQGRRTEAYDLLAPIYAWFTEGFDAPVLKQAKALLDELA